MTPLSLLLILLISGLILVGAEVFVPGGILGIIGALGLMGAVITAFAAFGPAIGGLTAFGVLVLTAVAITLWIRLFPRSTAGKRMTVSADLRAAKANESGEESVVGKAGVAASDLRPAGYATIDGRRVDVVTQGGMIRKGTPIRIVQVEGNRVVVAAEQDGGPGKGG